MEQSVILREPQCSTFLRVEFYHGLRPDMVPREAAAIALLLPTLKQKEAIVDLPRMQGPAGPVMNDTFTGCRKGALFTFGREEV